MRHALEEAYSRMLLSIQRVPELLPQKRALRTCAVCARLSVLLRLPTVLLPMPKVVRRRMRRHRSSELRSGAAKFSSQDFQTVYALLWGSLCRARLCHCN